MHTFTNLHIHDRDTLRDHRSRPTTGGGWTMEVVDEGRTGSQSHYNVQVNRYAVVSARSHCAEVLLHEICLFGIFRLFLSTIKSVSIELMTGGDSSSKAPIALMGKLISVLSN